MAAAGRTPFSGGQSELRTFVGTPERRRSRCLWLRDWAWSESRYAMGEGASSHEVPSFSLFDRKKGVGFFKFIQL